MAIRLRVIDWRTFVLLGCATASAACSSSADDVVERDTSGGASGAGTGSLGGAMSGSGGSQAGVSGGGTASAGASSPGGAHAGGANSANGGSAGSPASGGSGTFTPSVCAQEADGLPDSAPVLTVGQWKSIGPTDVPFGEDGNPNASSENGIEHVFTQGMALDPCNPATIYLAVAGYDSSTFDTIPGGAFRSTDAGSSWLKLGPFDQAINIRVDPADPKHLYVADGVRGATVGFWVSKDGGDSWKQPQGYLDATKQIGGDNDVYHVDVDPTDFNHALLSYHYYWDGCASGCTSGVLETKDGGDTWEVHPPIPGLMGAGGHNVLFLYQPELGIGDANTWLFGTQGAGHYRTTDAGETWAHVTSNSMEHGGQQLYYTQAGVLYAGGYPHLMKSTDNGATWTTVGSEQHGYMGIVGDGEHLYAAAHDTNLPFITASESDGVVWTNYNSQSFLGGSFQMVYDSKNKIVYSANTESGLLALKIGN